MATGRGEPTTEAILLAAERLYAERGLDDVSLREITRAAGARNTSAAQYHFGDRRGLVRAIVKRHSDSIDRARHVLLDQCERSSRPELDALAHALVAPVAAKLDDPDGGRDFLRIQGQLFTRPDFRPSPDREPVSTSLQRWRTMTGPLLPEGAEVVHRRFSAITLMAFELARRAERPPVRGDRLFVSNLVDLVAGVLRTEPSAATRKVLDEQSARGGRRSG